jgi:hypothetical protein
MRYRLRTLLILMAILPPVLAGLWFVRAALIPSLAALFAAIVLGICSAVALRLFGY